MNEETIKGIIEKFKAMNDTKIKLIADRLSTKEFNIYLQGYADALLFAASIELADKFQEIFKDCEKNKKSEQALFLILSHLLSER